MIDIRALPELVRDDPFLVHRGRHARFRFLLHIGPEAWWIDVCEGFVEVSPKTLPSQSGDFSLRAHEESWAKHWQTVPPRDFHDLFAMLSSGHLTMEGNLLPLMQNLQLVKDIIAKLRSSS